MNKSVKSRILSAVSVTIGMNIAAVLLGETFSLGKSILFAIVYYGVDSLFALLRNKK